MMTPSIDEMVEPQVEPTEDPWVPESGESGYHGSIAVYSDS